MPAPDAIHELVERFDRNIDHYKDGKYNETQVRIEFLDPFFTALGWDVNNKQGWAEAYKDVIHEDQIKMGGTTKAPDYCFRIGGQRKFFLEAKKPSVNVDKDISPAFQLRRYAWTAKLPLSILSDFEEFSVYDCLTKRPKQNDKASTARIHYYTYQQYADKWDEIESVFSREAILKGSFDQYAASNKKKRGTAAVDDEFLKEIEKWRDLLAKSLAKRNPNLGTRDLNYAVQKTIDRIIFLRICEDRGIEKPNQLKALLNGDKVYERLAEMFERADDRYNSGLFHFHQEKGRDEPPDEFTLDLNIDDKSLKEILKNLYYPESPYEFSVFSADILGQVYEQFLGKVIRLTKNHQAKVEEKPEVKKAGGVYYTPTYIVDYIVEQTVGKLVEGKTPQEVGGLTPTWKKSNAQGVRPLKVLDPACGSGSFLIGAYQFLLDWYRDWYVEDGTEKHQDRIYEAAGGEWKLNTAERKRILLDHIYGVDIDTQAVEVTKLSLLLKVLEGENEQSINQQMTMFKERALPDLTSNIKCGNSLIGSDFYQGKQLDLFDEEEQLRINAFDWEHEFAEIMSEGGFDAVIGNPPYDVLEKARGKSSWPHTALSEYVRDKPFYESALGGKLNLFRFFVVRSLGLTKKGGRFGNIIPLALLADISCANARRFLMTNADHVLCNCFPQKDDAARRVFFRAKLSTLVVTCRHRDIEEDSACLTVRVFPWNNFSDKCKEAKIKLRDTELIDPKNTPIPLVNETNWQLCRRLHNLPEVSRLSDVSDFNVRRGEINQTIYRRFISEDSSGARLLKGVEIGQYRLNEKLSQGKREWFNEESYLEESAAKGTTHVRRIATQRITGVDERLRIVSTLVDPPMYFADSTNSISLAIPDSLYDLKFLLGLLNSSLYQWRFKLTSTNNNGTCLPCCDGDSDRFTGFQVP